MKDLFSEIEYTAKSINDLLVMGVSYRPYRAQVRKLIYLAAMADNEVGYHWANFLVGTFYRQFVGTYDPHSPTVFDQKLFDWYHKQFLFLFKSFDESLTSKHKNKVIRLYRIILNKNVMNNTVARRLKSIEKATAKIKN